MISNSSIASIKQLVAYQASIAVVQTQTRLLQETPSVNGIERSVSCCLLKVQFASHLKTKQTKLQKMKPNDFNEYSLSPLSPVQLFVLMYHSQ